MTAPAARKSVSICICTRDRVESLRKTLASLSRQSSLEAAREILIVDNGSTQDVAGAVGAFADILPVRLLRENRPGLAHARNCALAHFGGDVLLFTDDDVTFDRDWLAHYSAAFTRFPDAQFFGGRILPDFGGCKPTWIGETPLHLIDGLLVWFDHGETVRLFASDDPLPFGASFALRRRAVEQAGRFRVDLGAGAAGRGEETEYVSRLRGEGQGVYVGDALCFHAFDPRRTTPVALLRYGVACGRAHRAIGAPGVGSSPRALRNFVAAIWQWGRGRGARARQCLINAGAEIGARGDAAGDR